MQTYLVTTESGLVQEELIHYDDAEEVAQWMSAQYETDVLIYKDNELLTKYIFTDWIMKATINLQLTYDEALKLAKYLPKDDGFNYGDVEEQELIAMRDELCEILDVSTYDL